MWMELDKNDLIALVKGSSPNYSAMDHPLIKKYGKFTAYTDWNWDTWELRKCSEQELSEIYKTCKESWNET